MTFWSEALGKVDEAQAGFRRGYLTVDNIFILQSVVQKYLSRKRGKFYCAFVDFSKAFDSVERKRLWYILLRGGIKGKMFKMLQAMYKDVKSCVRVKNQNTDYFDCPIGVRQGCMLSPFLFSFFINELISVIQNSGYRGIQLFPDLIEIFCLLFADDVVLFSDTIVGLQRLLYCLESYCKTWKLSVNLAKTKIMVFKAGGFLSKAEKWFFNGEKVQVVSYYKYLGIMFSCRLIWSMATKTLAQQSRKALMGICRATRKIGMLPHNTFFKIFDAMILPILTYGSEVWGFEKHDSLERIHYYA